MHLLPSVRKKERKGVIFGPQESLDGLQSPTRHNAKISDTQQVVNQWMKEEDHQSRVKPIKPHAGKMLQQQNTHEKHQEGRNPRNQLSILCFYIGYQTTRAKKTTSMLLSLQGTFHMFSISLQQEQISSRIQGRLGLF